LLAACVAAFPCIAAAQAVSPFEAGKWRSDLATLRIKMEERHKDLFHHVTQSTFDADVAAVSRRASRARPAIG
jgi:hypothetical protein